MAELSGEIAGTATAEQQAGSGLAAVPVAVPGPAQDPAGQAGDSVPGAAAPTPVSGNIESPAGEEPAGQNATPACAPSPGVPTPATNPKKKRKVAVLMAYVGHGYAGMQRNPGVKTIEDDLFRAIAAAGGISEANADDAGFSKIHWMRAARTDKGVSAVGQVVSLRMVLEDADVQDKINAQLPSQARGVFVCVGGGRKRREGCGWKVEGSCWGVEGKECRSGLPGSGPPGVCWDVGSRFLSMERGGREGRAALFCRWVTQADKRGAEPSADLSCQ